MKLSFRTAMLMYGSFALLAGFTLSGRIRIAVMILMAGLALKTIIADRAGW